MNDFVYVVGIFAVVCACLRLFVTASNPGKTLNQKFVALGNMKGMHYNQLAAKVGSANERAINADGTVNYIWKMDWFSITILFDQQLKVVKVLNQTLK